MINAIPIGIFLLIFIIGIKILERKYIQYMNKKAFIIYGIKSVINFALSGFFVYAFYFRFYKWINCFNENGKCYDPVNKEVYTDSGIIWAVPALIFLFFAVKGLLHAINAYHMINPSRWKKLTGKEMTDK